MFSCSRLSVAKLFIQHGPSGCALYSCLRRRALQSSSPTLSCPALRMPCLLARCLQRLMGTAAMCRIMT